jgi:hypothetical protein
MLTSLSKANLLPTTLSRKALKTEKKLASGTYFEYDIYVVTIKESRCA